MSFLKLYFSDDAYDEADDASDVLKSINSAAVLLIRLKRVS